MFGLVDWSLILTIGVILLATLLGSYLRSSRKDRCLKDFDSFHVTVEKKNNRVVWGTMHLSATGFELMYRSDVQDEKHLETSYILYRDEFPDIQALYRYTRDLAPEKQQQRARDMQRSFHPSPFRRMGRSFRNFMSTATESLTDVLGLVLGRVRRPAAHLITETSETYLKDIGKNIIGYVGTGYDPLLERYIGTRVVVEVVEEDEVHEHVGIFKDYSSEFLEILDVYYPLPQEVKLSGKSCLDLGDRVQISTEGGILRIRNTSEHPVYVEQLVIDDQPKDLKAIIGGEEQIELHVENQAAEMVLHLRIACHLDMIVPRAHALVRHRAERYDPDTIFDIGLSLVRRDADQKEIERLRQALRYAPHDAISAAALGELLYRSGQLQEARSWLFRALQHRHYLLDQGNRVEQTMRLLERRMGNLKLLSSEGSSPLAITGTPNGQDPATRIALQPPPEEAQS